jgi:hypothetical protein
MSTSDSERLRAEVRELTRHHLAMQRLLGDLRRMSLPEGVGRGLHGRPAQDGDAKQ